VIAAARMPAHPVKRELWRLLGGLALCALMVLAAYGLMDRRLESLRRQQDSFHAPALAMSAELASALAIMTLPPGVSARAVDVLDNEVAFVASVTREFGRAQALLQQLIALHARLADTVFTSTLQRLQRAADELQNLDRSYRGEPLALARLVSQREGYADEV
jgi:hypothetical protein